MQIINEWGANSAYPLKGIDQSSQSFLNVASPTLYTGPTLSLYYPFTTTSSIPTPAHIEASRSRSTYVLIPVTRGPSDVEGYHLRTDL